MPGLVTLKPRGRATLAERDARAVGVSAVVRLTVHTVSSPIQFLVISRQYRRQLVLAATSASGRLFAIARRCAHDLRYAIDGMGEAQFPGNTIVAEILPRRFRRK